MSRASRANGEAFEAALDAYHAHLAARGIAWIRRVGTPVKVLGKTSQDARGRTYFRAAFDGHQGCDFQGYAANGVHIVLEAKSHAGPDAWDSGGISERQWSELVTAEDCGCIAGILLRAWGETRLMSPSELWHHVETVGRRTVRQSDEVGQSIRGVEWWR
jgi:penicillin-binding protein-related factor A (putative recombinase)